MKYTCISMIDFGLATSVAKEQNYSWQKTINLANSFNLNSIQFYLSENCIIPQVNDLSNFKNIYLHLPNSYNLYLNVYMKAAIKFQNNINYNKLILHQNETISNKKTLIILQEMTAKGFIIGVENEGKDDLHSYLDLIKYLYEKKLNTFTVIDIHRFYNNFYRKYSLDFIADMISQIFAFCNKIDMKIILHLIDSTSFQSERRFWTPIFEGKIPYKQIFNYIFKKQINIESIILEYESEEHLLASFNNIKKNLF